MVSKYPVSSGAREFKSHPRRNIHKKEMKTAKIILVLVFLLLVPLVFAAQTEEIEIFVSGSINIDFKEPNSKVDYILSKFYFFPEDDNRQKVIKLDTQPDYFQKGESLIFRWDNPLEGTLSYGVNSIIEATDNSPKIKTKVNYPLKTTGGFDEYTKPSEVIDSEDPSVKQKAREIYNNEDDLFILVSNLAVWINENIEYDWNYVSEVEKASWVLQNKKGTCDEFSTLLIAFCRELGIPAKYIYGMAYADIPQFEGYGQHAWVEVYFPDYGWVPFDPSYMQLGYVDSSHIKLKDATDPDRIRTEFEWKATDVDVEAGDLNFKANKRSKTGSENIPYSMNLRPVKSEVGFGSYNLIELEVENLKDYYIAEEFLMVGTEETDIKNNHQKIVLGPKETKNIYWILKLDSDLDKKLQYQFPLAVYSARDSSEEISFGSDIKESVYNLGDIESFKELLESGQDLPEEEKSFIEKIFNKDKPSSELASDDNEIVQQTSGDEYIINDSEEDLEQKMLDKLSFFEKIVDWFKNLFQ